MQVYGQSWGVRRLLRDKWEPSLEQSAHPLRHEPGDKEKGR